MSNKIDTLDGVRGLALLNVLILHATGLFFPSINSSLSGTAQFGVWLFFVLSAFLLTNRFFVTGFSFPSLLSYFLGRALRILPVFFFAVFVYYWGGLFDEKKLIDILNFSGTYAHFWTIPVEFSFYFLLPVIAFACIRISRKFGAYSAVCLLVVLFAIQQDIYPYTQLNLGGRMVWYLPVFLCGMIISCLYMNGKRLTFNSYLTDTICFGVIVVCAISAPDLLGSKIGINTPGGISNKFVFYAPLLAIFVYLLCEGKGVLGWIMKTRFMTNLGRWSFSIYLWHLLIMFKTAPLNHNNYVMFIVTIISCIGFGAISFNLIEEPCERFRHRIMAFICGFRINRKQTI
ncbi:acyltransferase [Escherichia coli]|uniref:acyltransferase family protein n=1 Tax=Escherichia coli TaxID=562 RepID=UPI00201C2BA3|nr:acyltransferase [Escherichia coli]EFP2133985.1 acyltransferase [Escherichia coli]MCV5907982.1 acyltransferase [Escherichia coli]UQX40360.1 acyltransferase [Escherichia coli]